MTKGCEIENGLPWTAKYESTARRDGVSPMSFKHILKSSAELSPHLANFSTIPVSVVNRLGYALGDIIFASTASAAYFVGDGSQLTNLQRPISSSISTDITASNLNAGYYFRVGGNVTCSIQSSSFISCDVGSEFEFFQTSSAGNMLFLSGSGVTLNSKSGNITLTGQFSAATLKKVDNDEWDLIGDLS